MLDIENVNGILIAPDGTYRSFGIHSNAPVSELTDSNFHNSSFKKEISTDPWFQKLEQELNFRYIDDNIHRQTCTWSSRGIIVMIHAGEAPAEAYCISTPVQITDEQKEILARNYNYLQEQLSRNHAYFEAYAFNQMEDYDWPDIVYDIDKFYERLNIKKGEKSVGHKH